MRRWIALAIGVATLMGAAPANAMAEQASAPATGPAAEARIEAVAARVVVDGIELQTDVAPMLLNGRTMVPFRAIAEALGVEVKWIGESRTILATGQGKRLRLVVGERLAVVDGAEHLLDVAPQLVDGRTLVPARFFAEAFGATVTWDGATMTATVRSAVRPMRTLAFYGLGSYPWRDYIRRFSAVAFAWASITPEGALSLDQNEYFWPDGADEVLALAGREGVGRFLAVVQGDHDDRLTRLVLDPEGRDRLAAQVEEVVVAAGLEGVVLDLEGLGWLGQGDDLQQVRQGFAALVRAVSDRLRRVQKEVIVAVPPPNGWYRGYDYRAIALHADQVLVMAYGYNPPGSEEPEPLELVAEAIRMSLAEIPAEQILLGLLVEHENRQSVMQKVALAKRHNLAGIAIWMIRSLDEEEIEAVESLVTPLR